MDAFLELQAIVSTVVD